jgi:hypothetical protein
LAENTGGILSFRNFKEYSSDKQPYQIDEYPLFTDAHIIGQLIEGCEPYTFLNMVPSRRESGTVRESIMLRIYWYASYQSVGCSVETDVSQYHGGHINDEIAALVSLKLGIRLKSGGMTRTFHDYYEDQLGVPRSPINPHPQLIVQDKQRLILPGVVKEVDLSTLNELKSLQNLSEDQYVALLRAARLYQDAIWIAEYDPNSAWLMLISAVETAANQWTADMGTPAERLKSLKPKVADLLVSSGGKELLEQVADEIASSLGATNKFIKFCLEYKPEAPGKRPEHAQVEWTKNGLKKVLNTLYKYRSNALHGGTPFPSPMYSSPENTMDGLLLSEKACTFGLALHTHGASWKAEDLPINMNTFNYFVNGVLNNWWSSLISLNETNKN